MLTGHILIAALEEFLVKFPEAFEFRNWHKLIVTEISDLTFHVSLLLAGFGIHKDSLKTVMLAEQLETLRQLAVATFNDLGHDS